jgi:hypothetical protein
VRIVPSYHRLAPFAAVRRNAPRILIQIVPKLLSVIVGFPAFMPGMGEQRDIAAGAAPPTAASVGRRAHGRTAPSRGRDERRARTGRLAIVVSLFIGLLAATLLLGAPALIGPMLQSEAAAREAARVGDVLFMLPDGSFCRHLSFDNQTAQLRGGAVERCEQVRLRGAARAADNGFAWGAR